MLARWSEPVLSALSGGATPVDFLKRWAELWAPASRLLAGAPALTGTEIGRFGDWPGLGLLDALVSPLPAPGEGAEPGRGVRPRPPAPPMRESRRHLSPPTRESVRMSARAEPSIAARGRQRGTLFEQAVRSTSSAAPVTSRAALTPRAAASGTLPREQRSLPAMQLAHLAAAAATVEAPSARAAPARRSVSCRPQGSRRSAAELGLPEASVAAERLVALITRPPLPPPDGRVVGLVGAGHAAAIEAELARQFGETLAEPPAEGGVLHRMLIEAQESGTMESPTAESRTMESWTAHPPARPGRGLQAAQAPGRHRHDGDAVAGAPRAVMGRVAVPASVSPQAAGLAEGSAGTPSRRSRRPARPDVGAVLLRRLVADWPEPVARAGTAQVAAVPDVMPATQNIFNVNVHTTGGSMDDAELAERLTQILIDQARRHGIDIR